MANQVSTDWQQIQKELDFDIDSKPYLPQPTPLVVVISGPSGAGKDAVIKRMKQMGVPFHFVVTATTRPPRPGEVHGRDYLFVSLEAFAEMIEKGELLEYAVVYGDYKGIPKQQVRDALASGKDVILRVDVQGAATIRRIMPDAVFIFLTAESEEELVRRLVARKSEPPEKLKIRIATASVASSVALFDSRDNFDERRAPFQLRIPRTRLDSPATRSSLDNTAARGLERVGLSASNSSRWIPGSLHTCSIRGQVQPADPAGRILAPGHAHLPAHRPCASLSSI